MSNKQRAGRGGRTARPDGETAFKPQVITAYEAEPEPHDGTVLQADRAVVRNGRSQSITIPNHIAEAIGLDVGDTVRISVQQDGSMIIRPMETVHTGSMTIMKPRRINFKRPKTVPVIPEGRTIRKEGRLDHMAQG